MNYKLYLGDVLETIWQQPNNSIHLTVTSPPYDQIRDYHGVGNLDLEAAGKSLFDKTADGGVCVMVIQDGTKNFAKSTTTARTIVSWTNLGWKLFETCIYSRPGRPGAWWSQRFRVDHEYILIFFKGERPRCFDKEHLKVPAKTAGVKWHGTQRKTDGSLIPIEPTIQAETKCRGTVWNYSSSTTERNKIKNQHPAPFPDLLVEDVIKCFTKPGDVVFDPFVGSGTTVVMALKNGRIGIGGDIAKEYLDIAAERIKNECG
jgi:site-specific DNA-methyltransferase (adenine-specific)